MAIADPSLADLTAKADSGNIAAQFILAEPKPRIRILQGLGDDERLAMLQEAATLGYEPAAALFR